MADNKNNTVVGIFDDFQTANRVAQELINRGFSQQQVHVTSNMKTAGAGSASTYGSEMTSNEGGGIRGFFHNLFSSDEEKPQDNEYTGHYAEAIRRGSAVVAVEANGDAATAAEIMNENGAVDVDERVAAYRELGYAKYDETAPVYSGEEAARERERLNQLKPGTQRNTASNAQQQASIPVIDEELQVGKRVVQSGGVRIYSRMISKPVEETIGLRQERVTVQRRPADRAISSKDVGELRDQTIEVTEMSEEAVVTKEARVREEVVVGKEATERQETVRDTVRHTEVEVENLAGGSAGNVNANSPDYRYGSELAGQERFRGRGWNTVESDIRSDYEKRYPGNKWEQAKAGIRRGWDEVTGKR